MTNSLATIYTALNETAGKLYTVLAIIEAEIARAQGDQILEAEIESVERRFLETYLGEGIYAAFDGSRIHLRGPRSDDDCVVLLEPPVFAALVAYGRKAMMPMMMSVAE